MSDNILVQLFEHNNWANLQIIEACSALSGEQLDAMPQSVTKGTIRQTLLHLVSSQQNYLALLTMPVEERQSAPSEIADLYLSARLSGERLVSLAGNETGGFPKARLETTDGYYVEPWVVMVQAINHATEHREQICSMLSALGITPPDLDGWAYGEVTNTLVPISSET